MLILDLQKTVHPLEEEDFVIVVKDLLRLKEFNIEKLLLLKKNGRKSPFDRDKLSKSIYIALKKRPIDTDTIEKFITNIFRSLEELGQNEISSNTIGTMVMDALKNLDPVAYVRFASVYRNFREEKGFRDLCRQNRCL